MPLLDESVLDDSVLRAAQAGEPDGLRAVYESLAPHVCGYFTARGVEDPEALVSEVFLVVIPRLGTVVGGVKGLRTLVFSVAHARYVDDVRRRGRRPRQTPYDPENDGRHAASAESEAIDQEGHERVQAVLTHLEDDQRSVIAMRVLGELSIEQTAKAMGRSVGAVKQLQRRALLSLRSLLEQGEVSL